MTKKKASTSKEVAVKNEYAVADASMFEGMGLGAGDEIDTMDILIPNLMLTQGLTKAVARGKAQVGRYIDSIDLKDMGDSVEALVLQSYKLWQEFKVVINGKDEYIQSMDYYGNENLPYQFKNDKGEDCTRKQVLGFYVLLLNEIQEGVAFPYSITFKGASKKAGRKLSTDFAKLRSVRLPSFAKVFNFGSELVEDEHTYYVKTVDMGRNITRDELASVENWIAELSKNKDRIKVDDAEEREASVDTTATPVNNEAANGTKF